MRKKEFFEDRVTLLYSELFRCNVCDEWGYSGVRMVVDLPHASVLKVCSACICEMCKRVKESNGFQGV